VAGAHARSLRFVTFWAKPSGYRRGGHPAAVGWWQTPKPRRSAAREEPAPRHRTRDPAAPHRPARRLLPGWVLRCPGQAGPRPSGGARPSPSGT
jgi:hypothetical protein